MRNVSDAGYAGRVFSWLGVLLFCASLMVASAWLRGQEILFWAAQPKAAAAAGEPETVFVSPTECRGHHAEYRVNVKNDSEAPPEKLPPIVTPSEIADWPVPRGHYGAKTPRSGREKEWFRVRGYVTLVKCEPDGDLHVQLEDDDQQGAQCVVEVPVGEAWDSIRREVFSWAEVKFPCKPHTLKLKVKPKIEAEGMAYFDAMHSAKGTNRRTYDNNVGVWELHPVMLLTVLK